MLRIIKAIFYIALVTVIGFGVYSLFFSDASLDSLVDDTKNDVINTAIDASGIKETIQNALNANAETIASALGINVGEARTIIDNLDITSWSITSLPSDVQATGSYSTSVDGVSATVTLYDDSSYATIETCGQSITFCVPESAQSYLTYLAYVS